MIHGRPHPEEARRAVSKDGRQQSWYPTLRDGPAGLLRVRWAVSARSLTLTAFGSAEFLGESDEKPFRPADVAEPIRVLILDDFADELRAALAEPFQRLVDVVHGEHDAEVTQGVDRGVAVIRDGRRRDEAG